MTKSAKGNEKGKGNGKGKRIVKGKVFEKKTTHDRKDETMIHFDCEFTTPIRLLFREKRETLGLVHCQKVGDR